VAEPVTNPAPAVAGAETTPAIGHHWHTLEQEHDANVFGMWIFLATEVMLFGGLFLAYTVYHFVYTDDFLLASQRQNVIAASINTAVLLVSSLMMALAVHHAQLGNRRLLVIFLLATALLGTVFLGIKGLEYYQHWAEGLAPGVRFLLTGPTANGAALFYFLYFVMTGVHAIHLSIGVVLVLIVAFRAWRGHFLRERFTGVEKMGLYWHFVDVIWLFLFPLFYLVRG
jgi:cytochrome c oxidase subunit 3